MLAEGIPSKALSWWCASGCREVDSSAESETLLLQSGAGSNWLSIISPMARSLEPAQPFSERGLWWSLRGLLLLYVLSLQNVKVPVSIWSYWQFQDTHWLVLFFGMYEYCGIVKHLRYDGPLPCPRISSLKSYPHHGLGLTTDSYKTAMLLGPEYREAELTKNESERAATPKMHADGLWWDTRAQSSETLLC